MATVCKQIRKEVLSIFYAENTFILDTFTLAHHQDNGFRDPLDILLDKWMCSAGEHSSRICRVGAYNWGVNRRSYMITATIVNAGSLALHLGGDLTGYCECRLKEVEVTNLRNARQIAAKAAVIRCSSFLKEYLDIFDPSETRHYAMGAESGAASIWTGLTGRRISARPYINRGFA